MRIFVFGSTGMVGSYVFKYLRECGYNVTGVTHSDIEILNATMTSLYIWFNLHGGIYVGDTIINCAGLIRQKMTDDDAVKAIKINSIFPNMLCDLCNANYVNLIHISTDCCFSGKRGNYTEADIPDPTDIYGITKVAGEPLGCSVVRTSVIGESKDDKSLLEWVRSQDGKEINGFTNHLWSGVTCLQLAKVIEQIIAENSYWRGIRHYCSETVSKATLVSEIVKVYGLNIKVNFIECPQGKDMTLNTVYKEQFINKPVPLISRQLEEQRDFKL